MFLEYTDRNIGVFIQKTGLSTTSPYWRSNTKGFREANDLLAVKILIDRLQIGFQQAAIFFYTVFLDKSLAL